MTGEPEMAASPVLSGDGLSTSMTIDNIRQSDVGRLLDTIREAGFVVEINVTTASANGEQP